MDTQQKSKTFTQMTWEYGGVEKMRQKRAMGWRSTPGKSQPRPQIQLG